MRYEDNNSNFDPQDKSSKKPDDKADDGAGEGIFAVHHPELKARGYSPIPLYPAGTVRPDKDGNPVDVSKRPCLKGWNQFCKEQMNDDQIAAALNWQPDADVGICSWYNNLCQFDFDFIVSANKELAAEILEIPAFRSAPRRIGNPDKLGVIYVRMALTKPLLWRKWYDKDKKVLVELPYQCVSAPSIWPGKGQHASRPYRMADGADLPPPVHELFEFTDADLERFLAIIEPYLYVPKARDDHLPRFEGEVPERLKRRFLAYAKGALQGEAEEVTKTLEGGRYDALNDAAFKLGKYVHHGLIDHGELTATLLQACEENGYLAEAREAGCIEVINRSLRRSQHHKVPDITAKENAGAYGPLGSFTKAEAKLWAVLQHRADRGVSFDQVRTDGELIYKATLPATTDNASETAQKFDPISLTGAFNIWLDYARAIDPIKTGAELMQLWSGPIAERAQKTAKTIGSIYWEEKEKHSWRFPHLMEDYELLARASDADNIDKFNTEYAKIKTPVMIVRVADGLLLNKDKFLLDASERSYYYPGSKGEQKRGSLAEHWLSSPRIRIHSKVVFNPGQPRITSKNEFNMFSGFPVKPAQGNAIPFIRLMLHLCNRRKTEARYLLQWFAHSLQRPEIKIFSAPFFFIKNTGIGKSRLIELVGQLHGGMVDGYYREIEVKDAADNKNTFLVRALLVYVDEAIFRDKRATGGIFKKLITKTTATVDEKYVPKFSIDTYANYVFTSNYADGVLVEDKDRRYFVTQVPTKRLPQKFYDQFDERNPKSWWNTGGKEAVMYLLMNTNLEGFNPRAEAPMTPEKEAIIEASQGENERQANATLERYADAAYPLRHFDELFDLEPYLEARGGLRELNQKEYHKQKNYFSLELISRGARKHRTTFKDGSKKILWAVTDPELWGRKSNKDWATTWEWQEAHMQTLLELDQLSEGIARVDHVLVKDAIKSEDITCTTLAKSRDKDRIKNKLEKTSQRSANYDAVQAEVKAWLSLLKDQAAQRVMEAEIELSELNATRPGAPLPRDTPLSDDFMAEAREIRHRRSLAAKYLPARVGED